MEDLRLLAVQRAVVELSAVAGAASRARALGNLLAELESSTGDERSVLIEAADLLRDGRMLGDAPWLGRWLRET